MVSELSSNYAGGNGKRKCMCEIKNNNTYKNTVEHFHNSTPCPNEFETSFAPDRAEIVYCEQCYQAEVA